MKQTRKIYTLEEIKKTIYDILKKYEIEQAYVFGSYARGDATQKSDVDIMIKKGNTTITFVTLGKLFEELEQALRKQVDIVTEETYTNVKYDKECLKQAKMLFYNNILNDRVKIYG